METITMLDLRKNSKQVVERVKRGERMVLSYRGKNAVVLEPYRAHEDQNAQDLLLKLPQLAEKGSEMSNAEIDEVLYG